jgi:hypothetical protein
MTNISNTNPTGTTGRSDDAFVDALAQLVTSRIVEAIADADPDALVDAIDRDVTAARVDELRIAVARRLIADVCDDTGDESSILDGEQGIASRLLDSTSIPVSFAHRHITEMMRVTGEADRYSWQQRYHDVEPPTLYRAAALEAFYASACGYQPHPDQRVQLRRDSIVEDALHSLVDAIADAYAVSEMTWSADDHALRAMRYLRSVWLVDDDPEPRS